ncbi:MAG: integration host factor subunit beta [Paludibacteraceae bacterium]|nr:integration host factor subunit beta [Paludibacteraceae bacterium]
MTKAELVNLISIKTGYDKVTVLNVVESFMENVKGSIVKKENVYLRGFGTFQTKVRKEKVARNISKNTSIVVPEHAIPAFKPSKEFVQSVK